MKVLTVINKRMRIWLAPRCMNFLSNKRGGEPCDRYLIKPPISRLPLIGVFPYIIGYKHGLLGQRYDWWVSENCSLFFAKCMRQTTQQDKTPYRRKTMASKKQADQCSNVIMTRSRSRVEALKNDSDDREYICRYDERLPFFKGRAPVWHSRPWLFEKLDLVREELELRKSAAAAAATEKWGPLTLFKQEDDIEKGSLVSMSAFVGYFSWEKGGAAASYKHLEGLFPLGEILQDQRGNLCFVASISHVRSRLRKKTVRKYLTKHPELCITYGTEWGQGMVSADADHESFDGYAGIAF